MLLPLDHVPYDIVGERVAPRWLGREDEPVVAAVLDTVAPFGGLSAREADLAWDAAVPRLARGLGVPQRLVRSLWAIERRRWEAQVRAPIAPETLRDVLFELATRLPRDEAVDAAASELRISREAVVGSLFADRPAHRILERPPNRPAAFDLAARYNLLVAQSLLTRSMELCATVDGERPLVITAAKRDGLLARFEAVGDPVDGGVRIEIAGPLCLFRDTAKYGRSIARFVPVLVAARRWSVEAQLALGARRAVLHLASDGPVSFPTEIALSAAADGRLARRIGRALRTAGVRVALQPRLVRAGNTLIASDFALEWSSRRVLVDVVPFATPEYLEHKREVVARVGRPMLVCVDERHASLAADWLVPYRREIDAWTLWGAAQRLLGTFGTSFDLAHEAIAE
jgi:predicted nuclease of restriction endonuclease-like RecB superfamily